MSGEENTMLLSRLGRLLRPVPAAIGWYAAMAGSDSSLLRGLSLVLLGLVGFAGFLGLFQLIDPFPLKGWGYLKVTLDQLGFSGMVTYLLMTALLPLFSPVTLLVVTGSAAFGPYKGFFLSWLGCLLNANLTYLLVRSLGIDRRWGSRDKSRRFRDLLRRRGYGLVLILQLSTVIPFTLINAAAAGAGIPWKKFIKATCIGLCPSLLLYSFMGEQLIRDMVSPKAYFAGVLVVVQLLFVMALRRKRAVRRNGSGTAP